MNRTASAVRTLYVCAVAVAAVVATIKWNGLAFHTRDFPFYVESTILAWQSDAVPSINPAGQNLFGFVGSDGAPTIHHAIHFEPAKYVAAAVYSLASSIPLLLILYAAASFVPVLLFLRFAAPTQRARWQACLLAGAFVVWPSSLHAATYDLRPYILLTPLLVWAAGAVIFRRSPNEQVIAIALLPAAREEGVLFGLALIAYAWFRALRESTAREACHALRWHVTVWIAWALVTAGYFAWAGFDYRFPLGGVGLPPIAIVAAAFCALCVAILISVRGSPPQLRMAARLCLTLPVVFFLASVWLGRTFPATFTEFIMDPFYLPGVAYLLVLAQWQGVPLGLFAVAVIGSLWFVPVTYHEIARDWRRVAPAAVVRAGASELKRADDPAYTLVDYTTHQAFAGLPGTIDMQRLPWSLVPTGDRYHPGNEPVLDRLLPNVRRAFIGSSTRSVLEELCRRANLACTMTAQNDLFSIYEITRR